MKLSITAILFAMLAVATAKSTVKERMEERRVDQFIQNEVRRFVRPSEQQIPRVLSEGTVSMLAGLLASKSISLFSHLPPSLDFLFDRLEPGASLVFTVVLEFS